MAAVQVKIARVMALMPHEAGIGAEQRRRLRQFDVFQARLRTAGSSSSSSRVEGGGAPLPVAGAGQLPLDTAQALPVQL